MSYLMSLKETDGHFRRQLDTRIWTSDAVWAITREFYVYGQQLQALVGPQATGKSSNEHMAPFPHLAYGGQRHSIPDPLTEIHKNTELRGFRATQKLGSRVIYEFHAGEEQYDMGVTC